MEKPRRETKVEFWSRVEREGRLDEAKAAEAELLAAGSGKRHVQVALVERFQPLDGSLAIAWQTPNSWEHGRVDARKPPPDPQEQFDLDAEWVHGHQGQPLEEAPTPGAKLLLVMAQERPVEFVKLYAKCAARLATRRQQELSARRNQVVARREAARQRREDLERAARKREQALVVEAKRKKWREDKAVWRAGAKEAERQEQARERERLHQDAVTVPHRGDGHGYPGLGI